MQNFLQVLQLYTRNRDLHNFHCQASKCRAPICIATLKTPSSSTPAGFLQVLWWWWWPFLVTRLAAAGWAPCQEMRCGYWLLSVFRVCAQPPPLLPQAPPVQWGLPGHDDGGAAGRGRDQQQHYQVPRDCGDCHYTNLLLVVRSLIFILFSVSCCRKAGSISSLNGTEIKWVSNLFRFLWVNNSFRWHLVAGKLAPYPTSTAQIPKKKISSYPPDHPRHKPGPSWRWVILLNASNDNLKF